MIRCELKVCKNSCCLGNWKTYVAKQISQCHSTPGIWGIITENRKYIYYAKPRIENSSTALWLVTGLTLDKLSSKRTNVRRLPPLGTVTFCENHRSIIVMWVGVILYKSHRELFHDTKINFRLVLGQMGSLELLNSLYFLKQFWVNSI